MPIRCFTYSFNGLAALLCAVALCCLPAIGQEKVAQPSTAPDSHARAALQDGLYAVAREQLTRLLKNAVSPDKKAEYAFLLSEALYELKEYDEMKSVLIEYASADCPCAEGMQARLAFAEFALENWKEALRIASEFEGKYPGSSYAPDMVRLQALSNARLGNIKEAAACFARFSENYRDSPKWPFNLLEWGDLLSKS
jgi:TolA-binding protein